MPAKRWVLLRRVESYDPAAMTAVVIEGMDLLERKPGAAFIRERLPSFTCVSTDWKAPTKCWPRARTR